MRSARIERQTAETQVAVEIDLDGTGRWEIVTGVGFFDHMLSHVAAHGLVDLSVHATGDLGVDAHHTVEDTGIALGQALRQALGDRRGIARYGQSLLPMDDALALVALDFSNRGLFVGDLAFSAHQVGGFDVELVSEFLRALAHHGGLTLHARLLCGENTHHQIEAVFKALGRALRQAVTLDPRRAGDVPSTKGVL
ncbi:MAG: imidazoleglycerol-phosphate dehydratase HisB [Anaerolineae bacterium]|nr:imidazoleglycerol-phosphate dehydratase HisB [Anaerolineae bacterium]